MRLAIVAGPLSTRGGAERVVLEIARHFNAPIHTLEYAPEKTYDEFRKFDIHTPKKSLGSPSSVLYKARYASYYCNLKVDDYDLIDMHDTPSEWARNRNWPAIWYCNSPHRFAYSLYESNMTGLSPLDKLSYAARTAAFRHLDSRTVPRIEHIFANSQNIKGRIAKYFHRESEVLYPGVSAEKFSCRGYEQFFFYPSRFIPEKRFEYAIEAFRRFSSGRKGWKLVICGSCEDESSDYFKKVKSICDDSVIIKNNVDEKELYDLYSRCYAALFSPLGEDFGLVPLEAMASSKPVIAVNEGGPKETVSHGVDGFLVNSPGEMAQSMDFLAGNPDLCAEMGKAGREKVKKNFTWEHFLKRFEEKAEELAKG